MVIATLACPSRLVDLVEETHSCIKETFTTLDKVENSCRENYREFHNSQDKESFHSLVETYRLMRVCCQIRSDLIRMFEVNLVRISAKFSLVKEWSTLTD